MNVPVEMRLVSEYTPERGYVVRQETEADRAFFAVLREAAERRAAEPSRGWSMPVGRHVYAALKRLEAKRQPPKLGHLVVFDDAWGPYRAGRRLGPPRSITSPRPRRPRYRTTGAILRPVRGFDTLQGAMAWGMKTGRSVVYAVTFDPEDLHKLPDHHDDSGSAWWVDRDVPLPAMRCVFSAMGDAQAMRLMRRTDAD